MILGSRSEKRGIEAVEKLKESGVTNVVFHQLDVTDAASVAAAADFVKTNFGKLDILVSFIKIKQFDLYLFFLTFFFFFSF